jgi:hypothetical protein
MSKYLVWRLVDSDRDLWLPTPCDTFDQAALGWLDCASQGMVARITEDVPIALQDARTQPKPKPDRPVQHGARNNSRSSQIIKVLQAASGPLSRKQIAEQTGILPTDVGSALAGLMKRRVVSSEDGEPSDERGRPPPGKTTITLYTWNAAS